MPLREDLLTPIPGDNPSGSNLRYDPVYDQIKEARREDEGEQGVFHREAKKADSKLVIKLAGDTLATRSKDLQLAAWLTEALLRREGFPGLKEGLELLRGLLDNFWDTLYPELEDGDAELRATPLDWVGSRLDEPIKRVPLTKSGLDWFKYRESREVPYEAECASDEKKRKVREEALQDEKYKKLTPEEYDADFNATPESFYQQRTEQLEACLGSLQALDGVCRDKFGDYAPSFGPLKTMLEDVHQSARILLGRKRPKPAEVAPEEAPEEAEAAVEEAYAEDAPAAARPARRRALAAEPADTEDAIDRVRVAARYLRQQDPYSPAPYLMLRGLRWGELRTAPPEPDPAKLEPPSTDVRQQIKSLARDAQWQELLEAAETAMGAPCGRAWLDLQRYVVKACEELGSYYDPIASAIRSELRTLLADLPQLAQLTLTDDTPTANAETQAWLRKEVTAPQQMPGVRLAKAPEETAEEEPGVVDAYDLAMQAVRSGQPQEAVEILTHEAAQERSGRARFQRRIQLAQVCLGAGYQLVAYQILEDLASEIERRKLEEWEASDMIAHPLTLLFRCMDKLGFSPEEKQKIYGRICRLDPVQALTVSK